MMVSSGTFRLTPAEVDDAPLIFLPCVCLLVSLCCSAVSGLSRSSSGDFGSSGEDDEDDEHHGDEDKGRAAMSSTLGSSLMGSTIAALSSMHVSAIDTTAVRTSMGMRATAPSADEAAAMAQSLSPPRVLPKRSAAEMLKEMQEKDAQRQ